ncbi:MAG TPA: type II toxin-antitoxin system HicA family toxin [Pseudobdellovibrionaceae bacterium]|nr:type II toxin-antitoxin system HicA family toxin [Pseudobdellovibrionaceae bacterium]
MTKIEKLEMKLWQGAKLSCQEVRKLLQSLGYEMKRQKGSHEQWVKAGRTLTLACHGHEAPHYILDALKRMMKESHG